MEHATPTPPRGETRYSVSIKVDCRTRDMFVAHRVTNISRGGLFMEGSSLPIDSELDLQLHLGEHEVIEVRARVVWNYDMRQGTARLVRGMGVKFVGLSAPELARLNSFLNKVEAPPHGATQTAH